MDLLDPQERKGLLDIIDSKECQVHTCSYVGVKGLLGPQGNPGPVWCKGDKGKPVGIQREHNFRDFLNQQDHRDPQEIKEKNEIRSKTKGGKKKQGHRVIDNRYTGKSNYYMVC